MSKNVVTPKNVSFEDALRNLASHLTGRPAAELPRSQEAIVQYMAENIPDPAIGRVNADELAEMVTQKVMARIKPDELAKAITQEVQEIMARELGVPPESIPLEEPGSYILTGETKEARV